MIGQHMTNGLTKTETKTGIERIAFPFLVTLVVLWAVLFWLTKTDLVSYKVHNLVKDILILLTIISTPWAFVTIILAPRLWQKIVSAIILGGYMTVCLMIVIAFWIVAYK